MTRTVSIAIGLVALVAADARAQQTVSDVLKFLVTNQGVATGSVERDVAAAQATSDTISRALQANLATLPLTASTGAFAYRLNPELGTVERASETFGPAFVERAFTIGRNRASLGFSAQYLRFDSLDGQNLRDGSLVTTANQFTDEPAPFDVDRLTLNIHATIATVYGTVGIGDRMDLAVEVPMVSLHLDGTRVNTYRGTDYIQATASADTVGLSDILVRAKVNVYSEGGASAATAIDVRLPTGDQNNLLGAGRAAVKLSGIGSAEHGPFSAHANVGISVGGLATEFTYGGAVTAAAGSRVTLTGEVLGRWLDTPGSIVPVAAPHPTLAGVETIRLLPGDDHLASLVLVPGLKWNAGTTWVLVANVSVPTTDSGLRYRLAPFAALEYAFNW